MFLDKQRLSDIVLDPGSVLIISLVIRIRSLVTVALVVGTDTILGVVRMLP